MRRTISPIRGISGVRGIRVHAPLTQSRTYARAPFVIAAFAATAISACTFEQDETGNRPVEVTTTPVTVASNPGTVTSGVDLSDSGVKPPRVVTVTFSEGETAFNEKRYKEATSLFTTYLETRPDNAWGHYMLGLSAWKAGDLTLSREAFERSIELDRKHAKSYVNLARVLIDQGEPKEARRYVDGAIKLDSSSAEAYRIKGRVHGELKQHEEAIVSYKLALSLDPKDVWSLNNMALIMIRQQRYGEALGPLALAVQTDSNVAVFHNNLGIVLEHLGEYGLATNEYRQALRVDSTYTKALLSLARVDNRPVDPTVTPVDLVAVAERFSNEIRESRGAALVAGK